MSGTVEAIYVKISEKLTLVNDIFEQLIYLCELFDVNNIDYKPALERKFYHIHILKCSFDELESDFNLSVVGTMVNYYMIKDHRLEEETTTAFYRIVDSNNYLARIDEYIHKIVNILDILVVSFIKKNRRAGVPMQSFEATKVITSNTITPLNPKVPLFHIIERIKKKLETAEHIKVRIDVKHTSYDECVCGTKMDFIHETSRFYCPDCNVGKNASGATSAELNPGVSDQNKSKSGKAEPTKHFLLWLERVQGKRKVKITQSHFDRMETLMNNENIELRTVYDMRALLKELRLTKYNDDSSFLMKRLTNITPPHLGFVQTQRFITKFNMIIGFLDELKNIDVSDPYYERVQDIINDLGVNNPYYPYFIYKITESEILHEQKESDGAENIVQLERLKLYIYLQSDSTLVRLDNLYEIICSMAQDDEFVFVPTDRVSVISGC